MLVINNFIEYKALEGQMVGFSDWHTISQEQINKFSEATLDDQWIHTNKERSAIESPFKSIIAHGYLLLSLLPYLWKQIAEVRNVKMEINYGIENFKFGHAVTVDSEVKLQATVKSVTDLRGTIKVVVEAKLLIRNEANAANKGDVIFLYHFTINVTI